MPENVLYFWNEVFWVAGGALVLILFAVTLAMKHKPKVLPGSMGHRDDTGGHEEIRPDGYIDSFAGVIEEAGGGMPPVVKIALPGILIWFVVYLILGLF